MNECRHNPDPGRLRHHYEFKLVSAVTANVCPVSSEAAAAVGTGPGRRLVGRRL